MYSIQRNTILKGKKMANDFDFGFTSEDEFKGNEIQLEEKVKGLRDMIMPLLNNLKQNPDKDIIKWAGVDRIKQIDTFIKKMDDYINS